MDSTLVEILLSLIGDGLPIDEALVELQELVDIEQRTDQLLVLIVRRVRMGVAEEAAVVFYYSRAYSWMSRIAFDQSLSSPVIR